MYPTMNVFVIIFGTIKVLIIYLFICESFRPWAPWTASWIGKLNFHNISYSIFMALVLSRHVELVGVLSRANLR